MWTRHDPNSGRRPQDARARRRSGPCKWMGAWPWGRHEPRRIRRGTVVGVTAHRGHHGRRVARTRRERGSGAWTGRHARAMARARRGPPAQVDAGMGVACRPRTRGRERDWRLVARCEPRERCVRRHWHSASCRHLRLQHGCACGRRARASGAPAHAAHGGCCACRPRRSVRRFDPHRSLRCACRIDGRRCRRRAPVRTALLRRGSGVDRGDRHRGRGRAAGRKPGLPAELRRCRRAHAGVASPRAGHDELLQGRWARACARPQGDPGHKRVGRSLERDRPRHRDALRPARDVGNSRDDRAVADVRGARRRRQRCPCGARAVVTRRTGCGRIRSRRCAASGAHGRAGNPPSGCDRAYRHCSTGAARSARHRACAAHRQHRCPRRIMPPDPLAQRGHPVRCGIAGLCHARQRHGGACASCLGRHATRRRHRVARQLRPLQRHA